MVLRCISGGNRDVRPALAATPFAWRQPCTTVVTVFLIHHLPFEPNLRDGLRECHFRNRIFCTNRLSGCDLYHGRRGRSRGALVANGRACLILSAAWHGCLIKGHFKVYQGLNGNPLRHKVSYRKYITGLPGYSASFGPGAITKCLSLGFRSALIFASRPSISRSSVASSAVLLTSRSEPFATQSGAL